MFTDIFKKDGPLSAKDIRSEASRKAWLKRQRAKQGKRADNSLSDHYDLYDDPDVTQDTLLSALSREDREEVLLAIKMAETQPTSLQDPTIVHQDGPHAGEFTDERRALHKQIIDDILSDANIEAATPATGEAPTFVVLGGRGGSGKSSFTWGTDKDGNIKEPKVNEFDSRKYLVLDSDAIKERLKPPYKGWNAYSVHEESSVLFDAITQSAAEMGLNFIHDATLKSDGVRSTIEYAKASGYRVEGHYMFVPRQVSAQRAIGRYLGKGPKARGRLVPPEIILGNTRNERNFDALKPEFDKWSAYDNQGAAPVLIERKATK
jgi:predicted ABC-type ATPase